MKADYQVFVDLSFQGRLRKSNETFQVEIFLFTRMLEQYGMTMIGVPGYTVPVNGPREHSSNPVEFLLKAVGVWTHLWLEERSRGVFVLYDKPRKPLE